MIGTGTTETTTESQNIVKVLTTSVIEHSLPFWSREGWGGFAERLDNDGFAERAAPGVFVFKRDRSIASPRRLTWSGIRKATVFAAQ
jgi:hypothetical protein